MKKLLTMKDENSNLILRILQFLLPKAVKMFIQSSDDRIIASCPTPQNKAYTFLSFVMLSNLQHTDQLAAIQCSRDSKTDNLHKLPVMVLSFHAPEHRTFLEL